VGKLKYYLDRLRVLFQIQRGLLIQYGWLRSWWRNQPVDRYGAPLPWITYPAIDFLAQFDFSEASVFEWGSGFSTLWWAGRCKHIASVESNEQWIPFIKSKLPQSVELLITPLNADAEIEAFVKHSTIEFDVIVIDNYGSFRWQCARAATDKLAEGGIIILDNSDQCLRACEVLRNQGFIQIDFTGFAPSNGYAQTTSIFFRGALKFRALASQPERSSAQPNPPWDESWHPR